MKIEVLHRWDDVIGHYAEWNRILSLNPSLSIFSTPEWLQAWWESYGAGASLHFLVIRDAAEQVIALVPLFVSMAESPVGRLRLCRMVGDGSEDSDNLEFISVPGVEGEVSTGVLDWIRTAKICDVCQLSTLPPGPLVESLHDQLRSFDWVSQTSSRAHTVVNLPATWEEYLKVLSGKERGKIGNLSRRLESRYSVRYYRCEQSAELESALDALFRLHQMRWALRNEPGSFSVPERRVFYRKMGGAFLQRGWLEFWFLELNGTPVAAQFAFRYRDVAYALQEGFDPGYSADSVGYLLRSYTLRHLIESGVRHYDFLGGAGESKTRWAADCTQYIDFHFAARTSRGGAYMMCRKSATSFKDWTKAHLPPAWREKIKSILQARNPKASASETPVPEKREQHQDTIYLPLWS